MLTQSDRGPLSALAVAGGLLVLLGALVMAGWLIPVPRLVQFAADVVPTPFNAGLAIALFGAALLAALRDARWVGLAAGAALMLIAVATLLEYTLQADVGIDQAFVRDWLQPDARFPGRMAANAAALFVAAAAVFLLGAWRDSREAAGIAAWAAGIVLLLAGVGAMLHVPGIDWSGWPGFKVMSLPSAFGFAVGGVGLLALASLWTGDHADLRSRRLGALIFMVLAGVGVNVWQALASVDVGRAQAATAQAAHSVVWQLARDRSERYAAFQRLVARYVHGAGRFTADDWAADAERYLDGIASIRSLLLVDGEGRIVRLVTRRPELSIPADRLYTFDAQRAEMLERALSTMQLVISPPMDMRLGGKGFMMLMPFRHADGPMAMVVGMAYDEVFDAMLGDAVPGYAVDIHIGGELVYDRSAGTAPGDDTPVERLTLNAPGAPWEVRVWPLAQGAAAERVLPLAVLLLGLAAAALVAVAFRYSMLARSRLATALYATERLRNERTVSSVIWENSRDVICTTDKDGKFVSVSAAAEQLWGYRPEELEGTYAMALVLPEDFVVTDRVRETIPEGGSVHGFVNRMQRRDGSTVYVSWSAQWSDELQLNVSLARDVTAMMEHERELAAGEERLRVAVEQTGRLVYDRARGASRSHWVGDPVALLGMTLDELLEISDADYWRRAHPEDRAQAEGAFHRALVEGGNYRVHYRWQRPDDGRWIWLEDAGGVFDGRLVAVKSDVSEQHAVEESLERHVADRTRELVHANTELEAFSYSVSHDLRTPLRAIAGFTELLREQYADGFDETGRHYLARIENGAARMGMLIDDLLTLGQVSRRELELQTVNLSDLAQAVVDRLREGEPGRNVDVRIAPGLTARCDPRLAEVVLDNLLGNAWKFTRDSDPAVIEFDRVDGAFRVGDNGVGFDMGHVGQLFGVFQRLHGIHEFPGTGIGLATVKRIVERHGGSAWAQGDTGKGANFFFTFAG